MRIAVLGAGAMGGAAARLIARHPVELAVLDTNGVRAERTAAAAGATAVSLDGTDEALEKTLGDVDAVAACLPYRLNLRVMEASLRAGCPYADLGGLFHTTLRQLELGDRFREAGLPAVLGIGMAPGITNLLARLGSERLDTVTSVDLVNGSIDPGGFGVPYSAETILDEFTAPAMVFEGGTLREVPAASGGMRWTLPEPIGEMEAVYTLHSELATLPRTIEGVRDVRWRLALPPDVERGFRMLVDLGLASDEAVETPSGPVAPRDVLLAILARAQAPGGPPQDREGTDVRVVGTVEGLPATFLGRVLCLPPPEGIAAGAFGTALPIAVAVRWLADGRVPPGVHPPETGLPAEAFLAELASEGLRITSSVEQSLA
jgi:saccharopine dehydrogenase-like NADP-dependent oxidoreductase